MLKLILISVILLILAFAGIALKIWTKKDGEFYGTCSGKNVLFKAQGLDCGCGNNESCKNQ